MPMTLEEFIERVFNPAIEKINQDVKKVTDKVDDMDRYVRDGKLMKRAECDLKEKNIISKIENLEKMETVRSDAEAAVRDIKEETNAQLVKNEFRMTRLQFFCLIALNLTCGTSGIVGLILSLIGKGA